MLDWSSIAAIGALVVSGLVLLNTLLDKSLSIREHDEYRKGVERAADVQKENLQREVDKLEARIGFIEQTRPTTEVLKTSADSLKEQLIKVETRIEKIISK